MAEKVVPPPTIDPDKVKLLIIEDQDNTGKIVAKHFREALKPTDEVFVAEDIEMAHNFMSAHPDMTEVLIDAILPPRKGEPAGIQHTCQFIVDHREQWPNTLFIAWSEAMNVVLYPHFCPKKVDFKNEKGDIPKLVSKVLEFIRQRRQIKVATNSIPPA